MKKLLNLAQILMLAALAFSFTACDDDDDSVVIIEENAAEFAADNDDLDRLVSAASKAGLSDILANTSPITVFAPTNTAFDNYLQTAGTDDIENTPASVLQDVLSNHIIGGDFESVNLQTGYYTTLNTTSFDEEVDVLLYVNVENGFTFNGEAEVIEADNQVNNGTVHIINEVIPTPTVVTFATADPNFDMLEAALTRSDLTTDFASVLSEDGPFTVFAPTNAAFEELLDSNNDWDTLSDIPADVLEKVLKTHVVASNYRATDFADEDVVNTFEEGETLIIDIDPSSTTVVSASSEAEIITADVQAENGVIHAIDAVLLPDNL